MAETTWQKVLQTKEYARGARDALFEYNVDKSDEWSNTLKRLDTYVPCQHCGGAGFAPVDIRIEGQVVEMETKLYVECSVCFGSGLLLME